MLTHWEMLSSKASSGEGRKFCTSRILCLQTYKDRSEILSFWYVDKVLEITYKVGNNLGFHMTARLQR